MRLSEALVKRAISALRNGYTLYDYAQPGPACPPEELCAIWEEQREVANDLEQALESPAPERG